MNISAFCLITNPDARQDPWQESIASVLNFADEVVVIDGSHPTTFAENRIKLEALGGSKIKHIEYFWDQSNWSWSEFPKRFNLALNMCTGHWAIRFDVDYIFPEDWKQKIQEWVWMHKRKRIITFQKVSSVLSTRFYQKGPSPLGFNKWYDHIAFGRANDTYTDLCAPIIQEGFDTKLGVPFGRLVPTEMIGRTSLKFCNYDYAFKTKEFTTAEFHRFSMAHKKHYGWTKLGETPKDSLNVFLEMMQERLNKCPYTYNYNEQPIFIQKKLEAIRREQFAHSGWGLLVDKQPAQPV